MLLSIDQVAERVGVHSSTVRRWLKAGGHLPKPLPVKAVGGGPLWRECDILGWREEQVRGGETFGDWLGIDEVADRRLRIVP